LVTLINYIGAMQPKKLICDDYCHEPTRVLSMPPQMSSHPIDFESRPDAAERAEPITFDPPRNENRTVKHNMMQELLIGRTRLL
jgi:hypothetical protein